MVRKTERRYTPWHDADVSTQRRKEAYKEASDLLRSTSCTNTTDGCRLYVPTVQKRQRKERSDGLMWLHRDDHCSRVRLRWPRTICRPTMIYDGNGCVPTRMPRRKAKEATRKKGPRCEVTGHHQGDYCPSHWLWKPIRLCCGWYYDRWWTNDRWWSTNVTTAINTVRRTTSTRMIPKKGRWPTMIGSMVGKKTSAPTLLFYLRWRSRERRLYRSLLPLLSIHTKLEDNDKENKDQIKWQWSMAEEKDAARARWPRDKRTRGFGRYDIRPMKRHNVFLRPSPATPPTILKGFDKMLLSHMTRPVTTEYQQRWCDE